MAETTQPTLAQRFPQWKLLIALFGALTAMLVAAYFFLLREEYAVLYRDLRPADAASIVEELDRQHVEYRLAEGGAQILAPASRVDALRVQIAGADLAPSGV